MVTTKNYDVVGRRIKITRPITCPYCGGVTIIKDYRPRKTKNFMGKVFWYRVPRIICEGCGKIVTVLPDFIIPFKQYTNL